MKEISVLELKDKFKSEILPNHKGKLERKEPIKNLYTHLYKFKRQRTLSENIDRKN
jgi:hypothetical protein